jgi:HD-GYP domain-containing protein (c-di-GMP phosphodiesterase class II)
MRNLPSLAAGLYSGSVGAAEQHRVMPATQPSPGLFILVDSAGRITDSLIADETLLRTAAERIVGRRIERVLFAETAGLISEVLKSGPEMGLSIHTEYDQETESGSMRLRAQFTRLHADRLSVNITSVGESAGPEAQGAKVDLPDLSAYAEILKDPEFVSLAGEICEICNSQFGARNSWLGLPAGKQNAIWLSARPQDLSPAEFDRPRIKAALHSRKGNVIRRTRSGKPVASGLFPLVADGHVLGLLGLVGNEEGFLRGETLQQVRRFAKLISSTLKFLLASLDTQPKLEQIQALREIDQAILSSLNLRETASVILETALQQLLVDAADILILNPHTETLDYVLGLGFRSTTLQHTHLKLGQSYAGIAARDKRVVHVRNLRRNSRNFAKAFKFESESFYTYLGIPLIARGEVMGVLEVFKRNTDDIEPARLRLIEMIAAQIAIAIDNSALVESLDRSNQDLSSAYKATIEGLSRALELRDRETEGHAHRVADLSTILAMRMGIKGEDLERAWQGALLHDIGKIGIPDKILRKPGKLTPQEWSIMRQHPLYAYNVLSQIDYLKPALAIPLHHHERWDGSGYPHGLRGEKIPLSARVFAVVDVFDALTSDRPYRPAWSKEQAIKYIIAQSGRHFDPDVVEVFSSMIGDFQPPSQLK